MSRINNASKKSNTTATAYCGACFNAGKTVNEYTSHWTRSSKGTEGTIICPLILSSTCGFCHEIGHWTKMCPTLKNKQSSNTTEKKSVEKKILPSLVSKPFSNNLFQILNDSCDTDSDNESDEKKVCPVKIEVKKAAGTNTTKVVSEEEFPALKGSVAKSNVVLTKSSWTSIVQKNPEPKSKTLLSPRVEEIKVEDNKPVNLLELFPILQKVKNLKCWADDFDSDEEEDEPEMMQTKNIVLFEKKNASKKVLEHYKEYKYKDEDFLPTGSLVLTYLDKVRNVVA